MLLSACVGTRPFPHSCPCLESARCLTPSSCLDPVLRIRVCSLMSQTLQITLCLISLFRFDSKLQRRSDSLSLFFSYLKIHYWRKASPVLPQKNGEWLCSCLVSSPDLLLSSYSHILGSIAAIFYSEKMSQLEAQRDGTLLMSTCCSCGRPGFGSQYLHGRLFQYL